MSYSFSNLAISLIEVFETQQNQLNDEKITVNDLLSKFASWYEKFRTAMDYGSEETIPRRAIERMLKRMLFLETNSRSIAKGLVRELIWAGYFPNATVPHSLIERVANSIDLHLKLKDEVTKQKVLSSDKLNEFTLQILSCEIFYILLPNKEKEAVTNFMFRVLSKSIRIEDETDQTKDIQVFLAIRKSFAKDDIAFLKYKLFTQIFGRLSDENFDNVVKNFINGYKEIRFQLSYPKKERILSHIKKVTPAFLILFELLTQEKGNIKLLAKDQEVLRQRVFDICERKYRTIRGKIQRAIIRSFIFILFTKALIAFAVEGAFESIFFGRIQWLSILLNTILPPTIMGVVGVMIRTPSEQNSQFIFTDVQKLLFEEDPVIAHAVSLTIKRKAAASFKDYIFSALWIFTIMLAFGIILFFLDVLHFNILSKSIFIFFIAIISFLSYRIYQTANSYTVFKKQNILTPVFEFFFIPIIRVGRQLTEGFSQINFLLLVIDFIIEAPFKGLMGFFEQWFMFVANKREELE
ncbi:MAG: hypothetical protein UR81_C0026G0003 [Candidatus Levybacteria bacterium GW2011_GWB1_35_5]|nr:MAG: hypothetical protein UR81_C0026G0003 [Candidatus Levybacteria bacterium GW2011_GWB1_35_5]